MVESIENSYKTMDSDAKAVDEPQVVSSPKLQMREEKKSRSKTLRKVRHTFMKHINKLQNELEGKSAQLVREVGVSSVLRKELSDANDLNTLLQEENRSYKARIAHLESELGKEKRKNKSEEMKTNLNETIKSLRETMERQSKDDFETIQKLKYEMNRRVKCMEEEWATTLSMVEMKQSSQANKIRALETALNAERMEHKATVELCEKTSLAMRQMTEKNSSNSDDFSSSSISPDIEKKKEEKGSEKKVLKLEKKVHALRSALKRQKSKCTNLVKERDLIKESLEMWRQDDADNIVRRLEEHQDEDVGSEFENDKSFSDALKRLTLEARRQRFRLSKETQEVEKSKRYDAYEERARRGQDSSVEKRRSRRKRKSKKRVFYFSDKNLTSAFF